ncbi:MAG: transglycosylase domain-containing protein, partial [Anaerolineales bacterium]|nr:transglycosylase domain-containing protein [Anaerolineales bacterium]
MTNNGGYKLEYLEKYRGRPQKPSGNKNDKKKRGCLVKTIILLVQLGVIGLFLGILAFVGAYIYLSNELSDSIDQVVAYRGTGVGGTPRFYDRNGELLFELTTTDKRLWLAYSEIPQSVIDATVAVEDDTFWDNYGVDPAAIGAALLNNYRNQDGRPVGASTITQQLVRHIAFSYEERVSVSYERKLREIFLAFIMTQQRSKEAIIQMYLNEIYYGNLAYGIEAAAQTYFGKSAKDLTLAESAFLAGLPQSPLDWDPYTNFDAAKERQEFILDLMVDEGTVSSLDARIAKGVTVNIVPRITANEAAGDVTLEAPHFVLYVQNELEKLYGPDAMALGGWQITTSLDLNMQDMAETAARDQVAARAAAHNVSNASVVILKPGSGEILAMVGSLDYFDESIDGQVNIALSPRQPGSSIKPITYATALQRGWSTADVLWDVPIELDLGNGEKMVPTNYDGYYRGPVLFRDALANSYNIPPVQLLRDVGVPNFVATARSMGIESLREPPGFYGLALTLGGGEVPLLEMTHAFATLANQGQKPRLTSVLKITDSRGNVIFDAQQNQLPAVNAIDPKIAYIITDILDDDQARVSAMGYNNPLELP